jgi:hypothetical protein
MIEAAQRERTENQLRAKGATLRRKHQLRKATGETGELHAHRKRRPRPPTYPPLLTERNTRDFVSDARAVWSFAVLGEDARNSSAVPTAPATPAVMNAAVEMSAARWPAEGSAWCFLLNAINPLTEPTARPAAPTPNAIYIGV